MTTENIGLLKAVTAKMQYLDERQRIISANVANAQTPGYKAKDLAPVDFSLVLKKATGSTVVHQDVTHANHLPRQADLSSGKKVVDSVFSGEGEGNGVVLEEQLLKSSETALDYNMVTAIYERSVNLMRMALGTGR